MKKPYKCRICGEKKRTNFYADNKSVCATCIRDRNAAAREARTDEEKEQKRLRDREYSHTPEETEKRKLRRLAKTPEQKERERQQAKTRVRKPLTEVQKIRKRERDNKRYERPEVKEKTYQYANQPVPKARILARQRSEEVKQKKRVWLEKRVDAKNKVVLDRLVHGCVDCGEKDILVLEFDHLDEKTKMRGIAELRKTGNIELLKTELEKCVVLCANCHKRRTAIQFGNSWRLAYVKK